MQETAVLQELLLLVTGKLGQGKNACNACGTKDAGIWGVMRGKNFRRLPAKVQSSYRKLCRCGLSIPCVTSPNCKLVTDD